MLAVEETNEVESREDPHREMQHELEKEAETNQGTEAREKNAMRLTRSIYEKYGYTENCPRCQYYQTSTGVLAKRNHTPRCRLRLYEAMKAVSDKRLRIG